MIRFLTLSEVLLIYQDQSRRYGGIYGVRDLALLSSAIHVPQSSFNGEYLHPDIPAMAAAYAFHICQNHALIDGNKRTALAASLVFLEINGFDFTCPENDIHEVMMSVAGSELSKDRLISVFEKYSRIRQKD